MDSITASKFKATCLALLDRVKVTGEPLLITKNGEPVGMLVPPPENKTKPKTYFGVMKGRVQTVGDIVSPLGTDDWEVYRDAP